MSSKLRSCKNLNFPACGNRWCERSRKAIRRYCTAMRAIRSITPTIKGSYTSQKKSVGLPTIRQTPTWGPAAGSAGRWHLFKTRRDRENRCRWRALACQRTDPRAARVPWAIAGDGSSCGKSAPRLSAPGFGAIDYRTPSRNATGTEGAAMRCADIRVIVYTRGVRDAGKSPHTTWKARDEVDSPVILEIFPQVGFSYGILKRYCWKEDRRAIAHWRSPRA